MRFAFNAGGGEWDDITVEPGLIRGRTVPATHGAQFVVAAYPGDDVGQENLILQGPIEELLVRQSASDWDAQSTRTVTLYMNPDLGPDLRLENFE